METKTANAEPNRLALLPQSGSPDNRSEKIRHGILIGLNLAILLAVAAIIAIFPGLLSFSLGTVVLVAWWLLGHFKK